ncbi:MAG: hypothetical protein IVW36_09135 [Dehalococcoidia bacterium]|nr:hypothetical protein [Dehalococcoidia bacterium]
MKPAACQQYGATVVGVTEGLPQPGVVVCGPAPSTESIYSRCLGDQFNIIRLGAAWQFIPLPIAAGPVESVTFDSSAGTACITAAGQAFTFTLATRSVLPGCGGAAAATAPPEATPAATAAPAP